MNFNPLSWFSRPKSDKQRTDEGKGSITPGRVSVPDDGIGNSELMVTLQGLTKLVTPSFRTELIPLIRALYKVNPDVSIALQDMFKLANTGHTIDFPNNSPEEATLMREHLREATKRWSRYTAGIDGLVNKFIVQLLVGGAISVEGVPNKDLTGLETLLFIKPETIRFKRENNGVYHPYQVNPGLISQDKEQYIRLNTETYCYIGMYNDTDEPYGIPPFMSALDSIAGQHQMRKNFKHIMEIMGMVGFLEAKMAKPTRTAGESEKAYQGRLNTTLRKMKSNLVGGMSDGIVVGYMDDHEFELKSTSASMQNINLPWNMNQQSVANGLGVNGSIIGVSASQAGTEGGAGIQLSKMISQLKNIQTLAVFVLEFFYSLELRLAGFNNKGVTIKFSTTTVSDDIKLQQAREYRARVNVTLYNQGIISQDQFARDMGYEVADQPEPRVLEEDGQDTSDDGTGDVDTGSKKKKREADKDKSDRRSRDKNNPNPKRGDQDSKPR